MGFICARTSQTGYGISKSRGKDKVELCTLCSVYTILLLWVPHSVLIYTDVTIAQPFVKKYCMHTVNQYEIK